jgi:hypothetical protein
LFSFLLITRLRSRDRVRLHLDIRIDPASAINGTASISLCFRPFRAGLYIFIIIAANTAAGVIVVEIPVRIITLNETACRRFVFSDRQEQHRAVFQLEWILYETLTERRFTDDQGTVVILKGTCKDLRSRS